MIDHFSTYATDYPATKSFYEACLGALGYAIQSEMVTTWDADFPDRRACSIGPPACWLGPPNPIVPRPGVPNALSDSLTRIAAPGASPLPARAKMRTSGALRVVRDSNTQHPANRRRV